METMDSMESLESIASRGGYTAIFVAAPSPPTPRVCDKGFGHPTQPSALRGGFAPCSPPRRKDEISLAAYTLTQTKSTPGSMASPLPCLFFPAGVHLVK